jgi:ferredoxin
LQRRSQAACFISQPDWKIMTFVVTENCINCKHTDCVEVCPADAFREGANFLVIAPDYCIDCALCVSVCPVKAIYAEVDVPAEQRGFIQLNAELSDAWELIISRKAAPEHAECWAGVKDKLVYLQREATLRAD